MTLQKERAKILCAKCLKPVFARDDVVKTIVLCHHMSEAVSLNIFVSNDSSKQLSLILVRLRKRR